MTWSKREAVSNLIILGDEDGHKRKVGGLLVGMPHDRTYTDKVNYEIIQKDGETVTLSGSASLSRQINDRDLGKFIKCEFTGWGKSGNGKFKVIEVNVWEGEPTADMLTWPGYGEFQAAKSQTNVRVAPPAPVTVPADEPDDLPF